MVRIFLVLLAIATISVAEKSQAQYRQIGACKFLSLPLDMGDTFYRVQHFSNGCLMATKKGDLHILTSAIPESEEYASPGYEYDLAVKKCLRQAEYFKKNSREIHEYCPIWEY